MQKVAPETICAFRSAADLSSKEPAQLRRTIEELEARIREQDDLLAQKTSYIIELELKLQEREGQLYELETARSDPGKGIHPLPNGFELKVKMDRLEKSNKEMERTLDGLQDSFWDLYETELDSIRASLKAVEQMPATSESKSLYSRANKEFQGIVSAKKRNAVSPVNALRQLADLERGIIAFIINRPSLTFIRAEHYRGEVLIEALYRDPKKTSLYTSVACQILSEREDKIITPKQALRAMRRAAGYHSDKVKFEMGPRRRGRLCKIGNEEGGK